MFLKVKDIDDETYYLNEDCISWFKELHDLEEDKFTLDVCMTDADQIYDCVCTTLLKFRGEQAEILKAYLTSSVRCNDLTVPKCSQ